MSPLLSLHCWVPQDTVSSELSMLEGKGLAFMGVFTGSRRMKDGPHSNLETESEENEGTPFFKEAASKSLHLSKNANGSISDVLGVIVRGGEHLSLPTWP